ncbi:metallophosphoesterase [Candidatus Parcubacteria bacterium]|nr:metallophosphoesterase [Candidatus Parcubacteria bacterium]
MLKASKFLLIPVLGIFLFFLGLNVDYVSASNLEDGLVGHWRFNNGETVDYSGNENHLTNNKAVSTKGALGIDDTAFDFENASSSYLYILDDVQNNLDVEGDMSVSVWVNFESFPKNGDKYAIVAKYNEGNQRSYFYSLYNNNGNYSLQAILSADGAGNTADLFSPLYPIATSTWYHFVWAYNASEGAVNFFVNGINIGEASGAPNSLYNSNVTFQIGGYDYGYQPFYFDGIIDEVRIYNRVLSEDEINELRNYFNSPPQNQNFSFIHMTDPHIGSSWIWLHKWYEELSYPRFTDGLYEIGRLEEKPDFILMGGDLVEYAEPRWLEDYQSMIDSFTAQTSIPVYAVPGNHDRYLWYTGSALCGLSNGFNCDDELAEYKKQINVPGQGLDESNYLNPGNPLDYQFTHKGIQFIGLDSGADYMPDFEIKDLSYDIFGDKGIEGDGLTDEQMSALENLNLETPKVLFMHHPVLSGGEDICDNDDNCPREVLEDASFVNNYNKFFNWATSSNLQLALTGHTHRAEVYDQYDYQYYDIANAENRPLFIQTQSATHDGAKSHGYRLVEVKDGAVNPREVSETGEYNKFVYQLDTEEGLEFRVYDPDNPADFINMDDITGLSVPFFTASSSKKAFLYDFKKNYSKMQIVKTDNNGSRQYELETRFEGQKTSDDENDFGYYTDSWAQGMLVYHVEKNLALVNLKKMSIFAENKHQLMVNWDNLISSGDAGNILFSRAIGNSGTFKPNEIMIPMSDSVVSKMFSPAELVVINESGDRTGIVNHESIEEIDYSLSDEERERVLVYFKNGFNGEKFIYRVQGIDDIYGLGEDSYSLKIVLKIDNEILKEVNVIDMPINASTTYQFHIDWENLSDTRGVIMEIDKDGDGVFEIRVEMGQEINSETPYYLRKKMISDLKIVKIGKAAADKKINSIIGLINRSMKQKWWENDYYLNQKKGDKVFKTDLATAQRLKLFLRLDSVFRNKKHAPKFLKNKFILPEKVKAAFEDVLDGLLRSDIILARIAVDDFARNVDSKKDKRILKMAEKKLEKAEKLLYNKKIQVVRLCRQAWRMVN